MQNIETILNILDIAPYIGLVAVAIIIGLYILSLKVRRWLYLRRRGPSSTSNIPRRFTEHAPMPWYVGWPALLAALSIIGTMSTEALILARERRQFEFFVQNQTTKISIWSKTGTLKLSPDEAKNLVQQLIVNPSAQTGRWWFLKPNDPVIGIKLNSLDRVFSIGRDDYYPQERAEFKLMLSYSGSEKAHVLKLFSSPLLAKWLKDHHLG